MTKHLLTFSLLTFSIILASQAQTLPPCVTSWVLNLTGKTGYAGIQTNVQAVRYSASQVYISCTCIPGYDIGPWNKNPNIPKNQNFVFKIPQNPTPNAGTATATPLGHIGVWSNGVSIFNAKDAMSYQNGNVWFQNAYFFEGASFDTCLGHPAPNGEYHHHVNPRCLYNDADSTHHAPIIGYAFDGYPIYGAYGYKNTDGTGGIVRMKSGFRLRSITARTTLPGGGAASQTGPAISSTYPLGAYIQDYEFVSGLGLDQHNGRTCITPEYPNGTYAYFVSIDDALKPTYPYTVGETYYGVVPAGNTGPGSGHTVISEPVTNYTGTTSVVGTTELQAYVLGPNPASGSALLRGTGDVPLTGYLTDAIGRVVLPNLSVLPEESITLPLVGLAPGLYTLHLSDGTQTYRDRLVVRD